MSKEKALEDFKVKIRDFMECLDEDQREMGADYVRMMIHNLYDEHEEFMAIVADFDS